MILKRFASVALIFLALFYCDNLLAEEISRADNALNTAISNFVLAVTNDPSSDLYTYVRAMMVAFCFIGIFWKAANWAVGNIKLGDFVVYFIVCAIIWTFYFSYNGAVSGFWGFADDLAAGIQLEAVGTSDPVFSGAKISEAMENFFVKDISIFDGLNAIVSILFFHLIALILEVVVFIISMWGVWGYAFAKITGLIFLPLAFVPITNQFFQKWLQIFLGFWFFHLFSKIALSLYYLYFFAIFGPMDAPVEMSPVGDNLSLGKINLHFVIGIFFLISTGGLASMMASGFNSISSTASRGASQLAKNITEALT